MKNNKWILTFICLYSKQIRTLWQLYTTYTLYQFSFGQLILHHFNETILYLTLIVNTSLIILILCTTVCTSYIDIYVLTNLNRNYSIHFSTIASTPTFLYGAGISALSGANHWSPRRWGEVNTGYHWSPRRWGEVNTGYYGTFLSYTKTEFAELWHVFRNATEYAEFHRKLCRIVEFVEFDPPISFLISTCRTYTCHTINTVSHLVVGRLGGESRYNRCVVFVWSYV